MKSQYRIIFGVLLVALALLANYADAGNFALTGGFTAGAKDILALYVIADNNYAQISVANN